MSTFKTDLQQSQQVENSFADKLKTFGYTVSSTQSLGTFSGYDLIATKADSKPVTFEIKLDNAAQKTGNVAIELYKVINGFKENSGLSATTADYIVYSIPPSNYYYSIKTDKLKEYITERQKVNALRTVFGGDKNSTCCALVGQEVFKNKCKEIT
ncbi:hypothetical protein [Pedobacter sp. L105]|uniref:hypothetical protein n=1 Tax=Pedobacter sp. L105 TaxID=1641871 RepID=UPI00131E3850|nr:hypothetical protein [Pedobacter sp. L105]